MYNVYNFYKKLGDIMKTFNITGICYPEYHYMVKMEDNLRKFEELIDKGTYFCINRGRQYGKTTTLNLIKNHLQSRYDFIFLSFEGLSNSTFSSESQLYKAFFKMLMKKNDNTTLNYTADIEGIINELAKRDDIDSMDFSAAITDIIRVYIKLNPADLTNMPAAGIIIPAGKPGKFKYSKKTITAKNIYPYLPIY